jgi:hypothetical protein
MKLLQYFTIAGIFIFTILLSTYGAKYMYGLLYDRMRKSAEMELSNDLHKAQEEYARFG